MMEGPHTMRPLQCLFAIRVIVSHPGIRGGADKTSNPGSIAVEPEPVPEFVSRRAGFSGKRTETETGTVSRDEPRRFELQSLEETRSRRGRLEQVKGREIP